MQVRFLGLLPILVFWLCLETPSYSQSKPKTPAKKAAEPAIVPVAATSLTMPEELLHHDR